jgi:hypothetical protein
MIFTFNRGDLIGDDASSIIHFNLASVTYLQESDAARGFPSRWFISIGGGGWFLTKNAFDRIRQAMDSK